MIVAFGSIPGVESSPSTTGRCGTFEGSKCAPDNCHSNSLCQQRGRESCLGLQAGEKVEGNVAHDIHSPSPCNIGVRRNRRHVRAKHFLEGEH